MNVNIDLQNALEKDVKLPEIGTFEKWAYEALTIGGRKEDCELTIRFVESKEIQELNASYRNINKPTNILSFPFECPVGITLPLLGDLIVCYEVLEKEATAQNKTLEEHLAHLIVHGCLHLLGYDHIEDEDAKIMEPLEVKAVELLGYENPYKDDEY